VAAHVTLPSGPGGLSRVVATLTVNGTPRGQGVWRGSAWPDVTGPVRIAVGYDAAGDSTGPYRYTLEVRAHYGETMLADTARGELVVVNRRESVFGAGWWLAGLERLVMDPFGNPVLWVGGDGSTRRYTKAGAGDVWGAPSLDRPDSIRKTASGWERILGGGVKVEFDATGRHVATVNRLTHRTEFRYDSEGRVDTLSILRSERKLGRRVVRGIQRLIRSISSHKSPTMSCGMLARECMFTTMPSVIWHGHTMDRTLMGYSQAVLSTGAHYQALRAHGTLDDPQDQMMISRAYSLPWP